MDTEGSPNGEEERAFLEASEPPHPPSVNPPTARVTRSQALARVRRGEAVHADAAASLSPDAVPPSGSSSLERAHDSAMNTEVVTSARKVTGNTSGPSDVDSNSKKEMKLRNGGDGDAYNDYSGVMKLPTGVKESESPSGDKSTTTTGASPGGEVTGGTPVASRGPSYTRRAHDVPRLAAASLPRMLALQRVFETEAKHLYEFCSTHAVEWPALAVEWIPDRAFADPERDYTLQYIAVGSQTHPSSARLNTVKVMEVAVPVPTSDVMYGLYGDDDIDGAANADEGRQEFVDPGKRFVNIKGHLHCEQTLTMDAPVLKIRAMPAETNILAVKTGSGFIGVYNTVRDQEADAAGRTVPDAQLRGHSRGGFGLSWSTLKPSYIASASDDGYVNYYDVSHRLTVDMQQRTAADPELSGSETHPIGRLIGHRDIVTDCSWHPSQCHLLASSSMDGDVRIWDIRMSAGSTTIHSAHEGGATAAQLHPLGAFQLATAGAEGSVQLWDIRRTADPVRKMDYHGKSVTGLQWSPSNETVLASYSDDGRVVLWDVAKSSLPPTYSDDGVAPPEVAFVHVAHVGRVTDVSWNSAKAEDWLLASADTTNGLHVYRPLRKVVQDYRVLQ